MSYRPELDNPIPMILLKPTYQTVSGVPVKAFPDASHGTLIFGNFKSYGGTERDINGQYAIDDTAVVETWFRPDIKSDCRIYVPLNGGTYEIWNEPENINMRNQFLRFKVRRHKGGA
jgi:hypothetical protein